MRERLRAFIGVVAWTARAEPWRSAAAMGAIVGGHLATLGTAWALKLLVDAAAGRDTEAALVAAAVAAISVGGSRLLTYPVVTVGVTLRERAGMLLERRLMGLVSGMPGLEHHERPEYLDELELVRRKRHELGESIAGLLDTTAETVLLAGIAVLLVRIDPLLGLLPSAALAPFAAAAAKERMEAAFDRTVAGRSRLARRLHEMAVSPRAGMELRLFGLGERLRSIRSSLHEGIERERVGAEVRKGVVAAAGDLVFTAARVGAVAFVVSRAIAGRAAPGDVLLTVVLAGRVGEQVNEVIVGVRYLLSMLTTVGRLVSLSDAHERAVAAAGETLPVPEALRDGIVLADVSFRYHGTGRDVLAGLSLRIPAGTTVAIVGDNGAGKTTICKLLLRFYEPTAGRITVDGVDLSRVDADEWRLRTSAAFQDFARLELTVREAVGVGDVPRLDDERAVAAALERAAAADVVDRLPGGFDAQLGRVLDEGAELSGGQWQKVALGRTMMRTVPGRPTVPILLVLDEPTASLDAATEHALYERWAAASAEAARAAGAITVFVSHRFSTVRMADSIVVLDGGAVVEHGTHAELMALGGRYAELYTLQSRAYR